MWNGGRQLLNLASQNILVLQVFILGQVILKFPFIGELQFGQHFISLEPATVYK